MTDLNSIKRIRWSTGQFEAGTRWYGVTVPLRRGADKETSYSAVNEPIVKGSTWYDKMTPEAIEIVAKLYSMKGIVFVWVGTFGIEVQKIPVFSWNDYQDDILALLNRTLFGGRADVGECGAPMPGQGVIKWSETRTDTVRWYGVTIPLFLDEKNDASYAIGREIGDDPTYKITDQARLIVNTLMTLRGLVKLWVGAFGLSVQIAPVFDWYDFHKTVLELLNRELFDGKAFVDYKKTSD